MSTLLMRLAAPMQSWGLDAKYDRRGTERAPTKSGVVGIIAAALGRRRDAEIKDLAALRFGVRVDREGVLLRDYHTAKSSKSAYVTNRYYLCDAVFLAGLEGDEALLREIERALASPQFPLFLGRRSCPPEGRISLGLREAPLQKALAEEPPLSTGRDSRLRLLIDGVAGTSVHFASDLPLSFDQRRREYGFRSVREDYVAPGAVPAQPSTLHDPMRELEE